MASSRSQPILLVVSNSRTEAAQVKSLLNSEFDRVITQVDDPTPGETFDKVAPDVLVLAFDSLKHSELFYLQLFKVSESAAQHPHKVVVLCQKDEVKRAYQLCRKGILDDYVMFWPLSFDAPRLWMAVHKALHELELVRQGNLSRAAYSQEIRHLERAATHLQQGLAAGETQVAGVGERVSAAASGILGDVGSLGETIAAQVPAEAARQVGQGLEQLRQGVRQEFDALDESVAGLRQWRNEVSRESAAHAGTLQQMATRSSGLRTQVLVVDDEEFMRSVVATMFHEDQFSTMFASGGLEALQLLRNFKPDIILMDVMMPIVNGVEATRRIRLIPGMADIPIIIMTGKSEKHLIIDCMKAGAQDFIVKPFGRDTVLARVEQLLNRG